MKTLCLITLFFSSYHAMAKDIVCEGLKKAGDVNVAYEAVKAKGKTQTWQQIDPDVFYKAVTKERSDFLATICDVDMDIYESIGQAKTMCYNSCYKESFKISPERPKSWGFIKSCGVVCDTSDATLKAYARKVKEDAKNADIADAAKRNNISNKKREAKEMEQLEKEIYQAPAPAKKTQAK